jgi:pyruvate/2-oxoglutarate dehydrogenase complex dihydrolipoamide acyltransferase (E2) component
VAEIKVPELAESITEGTIAQWLKQPGDTVEKGEFIVELETDKVNVEVISEEAGVVQELLAQEGDTVEVGQVIAIVGEGRAKQQHRLRKRKKQHRLQNLRKRKLLQQWKPLKKHRLLKSSLLLIAPSPARLHANWRAKKASTWQLSRQ